MANTTYVKRNERRGKWSAERRRAYSKRMRAWYADPANRAFYEQQKASGLGRRPRGSNDD